MAARVFALAWVPQLLRCLPQPVLRQLDRWSHRLAQRKQRQRRENWQRRQAAR